MQLFKKHIYDMTAYQPPLEGRSPTEHLLLDFNERTLPVSDVVVNALCEYIQSGSLQKYPAYGDIADRLAAYLSINSDQVMITNGSDQGIELVTRASVGSGDEAIIPGPSFAMYQQVAEAENATIVSPRYSKETGFPLEELIGAISGRTRLIIIPLPNNPSGTSIALEDVERVLAAAPNAAVLVDECYYEYSGLSVVELIERYPNLVVARTFSKTWGIPSLRFGFLVSQSNNISQLLKIRGPYDVNQLAVVAAQAALDDPAYTQEYVSEVMSESKPLLESWFQLKNFIFWPSDANYLWVFPPKADELSRHLERNAILVRPKNNDSGELGLRISLGNVEQTKRLIACLEEFYIAN